jgi:hypothetical protein
MSAASKKKYFEDIAGGSTKPTDVLESGPTAPSAGSDRKLATVAAKETDRQFSAASSPMETTKPAQPAASAVSAREATTNGLSNAKTVGAAADTDRPTQTAAAAAPTTTAKQAAQPTRPSAPTAVENAAAQTKPEKEAKPAAASTKPESSSSSSKRLLTIGEKAYELWHSGNSQDSEKNWNDAIYQLACQRAHEIWLETGCEDSEANFHKAREEVIANGGLYV